MVAIVDYGVGNLFSLGRSLEKIGARARVTGDAEEIAAADRIILPGVGAFADAAKKLEGSGLDKVITECAKSGTPILGICLGMQLLFDKSLEFGEHKGLGLIHGEIRPIAETVPEGTKIPHIGWNSLNIKRVSPIFKYIKNGDFVYFVHSFYAAECEDNVIADTDYGAPLTAAVAAGNVFGCQFHPEKSGDVGLAILKAFAEGEV